MRKSILCLFFLFLCLPFCKAQIRNLICTSQGVAIPFVTVSFDDGKVAISTDENGAAEIPDAVKKITLSHVSYITQEVFLAASQSGLPLKIELVEKNIVEEPINVISADFHKEKFSSGDFQGRPNSFWIFHPGTNATVGFLMRYPAVKQNLYAAEINFKVSRYSTVKKSQENYLEIKFFEIKHGTDTVLCPPLNKIPIIIPFSTLKKSTSIKIMENILLPSEYVLISFELKTIRKRDKEVNFSMSGGNRGELPVQFIRPATPVDWGCTRLPKPLRDVNRQENFYNPDIMLKYQNYAPIKAK